MTEAVRWCGAARTLDNLPPDAEHGDVYYLIQARAIAVLIADGWAVFPL